MANPSCTYVVVYASQSRPTLHSPNCLAGTDVHEDDSSVPSRRHECAIRLQAEGVDGTAVIVDTVEKGVVMARPDCDGGRLSIRGIYIVDGQVCNSLLTVASFELLGSRVSSLRPSRANQTPSTHQLAILSLFHATSNTPPP